MTKKEITIITNEMAAQAGVKLNGGSEFVAQCTLVCKGRKIGEELVSVVAKSDKQARLAIKRVLEQQAGSGVGVVIKACTADGNSLNESEVTAMNTHGGSKKAETKVEETKEKIPMKKMVKIAMVGNTVDKQALVSAITEASKVTKTLFIAGDALNQNHAAIFKNMVSDRAQAIAHEKFGLTQYAAMPIYAIATEMPEAIRGKKQELNDKVVYVQCCYLSAIATDTRELIIRDALRNRADYLIGDAPTQPEPPKETKKEEKKPVTEATPAPGPQEIHTSEVKAKVITKLVELGRELEDGQDVVEDINRVGSFAHQSLGMSEDEINALIQKGVNLAKATQASYEQAKQEEREAFRKLGAELAENDMADANCDSDFYAEQGLTIQDEIDATINDGVLDDDEAQAVVKEGYDSVPQPSNNIEIPDEEPAELTGVTLNDPVDELAELVLISLKEGEAATARVMAEFVLRNTDDTEEATEIVTDILKMFSEVEDIAELANGLVIGGTLVRDGQYHKVVVDEEFHGSVFA